MKFLSLIYGITADLIIRHLPNFKKKDYSFAFIVHPRNTADIYRKYSFLGISPIDSLIGFSVIFGTDCFV